MIIKQTKTRNGGTSAVKALTKYLTRKNKVRGFTDEYPSDVGRIQILEESKHMNKRTAYVHIISSMRFQEDAEPQIWKDIQDEIKTTLGMTQHPHFSTTHYETNQTHMHTMIGTISLRGKYNYPWHSYNKLGAVRMKMEQKHGLSKTNENTKGLYARGGLSLYPNWDAHYLARKKRITKDIEDLLAVAKTWPDIQNKINLLQMVLLIHARTQQLALFDKTNRWLYPGKEIGLNIKSLEARYRSPFPYQRVRDLGDYLKKNNLDNRSLRPRATAGIDFNHINVSNAQRAINARFNESIMSVTLSGIHNYGSSLSVSLKNHGAGRAIVYGNGIEPYTETMNDRVAAHLIAHMLDSKTTASLQQESRINHELLAEHEKRQAQIKHGIVDRK